MVYMSIIYPLERYFLTVKSNPNFKRNCIRKIESLTRHGSLAFTTIANIIQITTVAFAIVSVATGPLFIAVVLIGSSLAALSIILAVASAILQKKLASIPFKAKSSRKEKKLNSCLKEIKKKALDSNPVSPRKRFQKSHGAVLLINDGASLKPDRKAFQEEAEAFITYDSDSEQILQIKLEKKKNKIKKLKSQLANYDSALHTQLIKRNALHEQIIELFKKDTGPESPGRISLIKSFKEMVEENRELQDKYRELQDKLSQIKSRRDSASEDEESRRDSASEDEDGWVRIIKDN